MTGTFIGKSIAAGLIPSTKTTIYTVPASTVSYIRRLFVFNTSATPQTVLVYVKRSGGSSRTIGRAVLELNESAEFADDSIVLSAADEIEAETTTASVVEYTITGAEET